MTAITLPARLEIVRLLYLYPEEWTGSRAREIHTLSTCVALARAGEEVTLVVGGGKRHLRRHLAEIAGTGTEPRLRLVALARGMGPFRSATIFSHLFQFWLSRGSGFDAGYIIHLKAAAMLRAVGIPYLYEAHEVFVETPQKSAARHDRLHDLEKSVLNGASWRVTTSKALAVALRAHYVLPNDFAVVPNAGGPPLASSIGTAEGPFVYAGTIADWKGLEFIIEAARQEKLPLRIVGGTPLEWHELGRRVNTQSVSWLPRVPLPELPAIFQDARAGLIPTQLNASSGRYSCPMKLFDYARCGLPVLSTALPSLESLAVGSWCLRVEKPSTETWATAMREFLFRPVQAENARAWAEAHTWTRRAEALMRVLSRKGKSSFHP